MIDYTTRTTQRPLLLASLIVLVLVTCASVSVNALRTVTNQMQNINYDEVLARSWQYYKAHYIQADGRVIDVGTEEMVSTSEGQSYALLRAVQQNDKSTFDTVLTWTYDNLGVRQDGLFAWHWGMRDDGSWGVLPNGGDNSATDGDEQTAVALLNAYTTWHDEAYLKKAEILIHSIYTSETTRDGNDVYIVAGNWANDSTPVAQTTIYTNPSYIQVAAYKLFKYADLKDNWDSVINTSYKVLNLCTFNRENTVKLPSNWCLIDKKTFSVIYTNPDVPPMYSYDAFRTMYHVAVDYTIHQDPKDILYLKQSATAYAQLQDGNALSSQFNVLSGKKQMTSSLAIATGALSNLRYSSVARGESLYRDVIYSNYDKNTGKFGSNYYDSNWTWFITYLYSNKVNKDFPIT